MCYKSNSTKFSTYVLRRSKMFNLGWVWKQIIKPAYFTILFLLLFIGLTTLFDTIIRSHCTISANFYIYLQCFQ